MKCCPIKTLGMYPPAKKYDTRWKMRARAITCPPKEIRWVIQDPERGYLNLI